MVTRAKSATLWTLTVAVGLIAILSAIFTFGPDIETRFFPVVGNVRATIVTNTDERMQVAVTSEKLRSCQFLSVSGMVQKGETNETWINSRVVFLDPQTSRLYEAWRSRPKGDKIFNAVYFYPGGHRLVARFEHKCHPFWVSATDWFELDSSQNPAQVR